ncbi:MAG: VanW family protein [Bacillota bacterium]|nr:VanW family protein [Bacillota bacterium]
MRRRARIFPVLALAISAAALGGVAGAAAFLLSGGGRILPGVRMGGLPVGGLTRSQARALLVEYDRQVVQRPVFLALPERPLTLWPRDFGLGLDVEATVDRAFQVGRRGSLGERALILRRLRSGGVAVAPVLCGGESSLRRFLEGLCTEVGQPPRNARFDPATGALAPEAPGREIALADSYRRLRAAFASPVGREVALVVRPVSPRVTLAELRRAGIRQLLAKYTTRFDPGDANRVHNLCLAAQALDGTLLRPGEILSFNRTVGERTEARGYRPAPEIVQERFVAGIGGGTCQVSSTLYNAALLAGLEVRERTAHSQPLGYVPPGRDATVYYGLIDLKIRNNRRRPVVFATTVGRDTLTVAVCGQKEDSPEVRLELSPLVPVEPGPELVEVDPALSPGERVVVEEARPGYRVKLYRRYYRESRQVASEVVSEDYYPPRPRRVKVGPPPANAAKSPSRQVLPVPPDVDLSPSVLYN